MSELEPLVYLDDFIQGGNAGADYLRKGFMSWLKNKGQVPLERSLRLPATPAKLAQTYRDAYLVQAANQLTGSNDRWQRAVILSEAIRQFLGRKWPAWQRMEEPPKHASDIERYLFAASKYRRIPKATSALFEILGK